jgi:hypothetical protein
MVISYPSICFLASKDVYLWKYHAKCEKNVRVIKNVFGDDFFWTTVPFGDSKHCVQNSSPIDRSDKIDDRYQVENIQIVYLNNTE